MSDSQDKQSREQTEKARGLRQRLRDFNYRLSFINPDDLGWLARQVLRGWLVIRMVWGGYRDDDCRLHASALTYYTLMSIVPLLALALALARVFGGESIAHERIRTEISRFGSQLASTGPESGTVEAGMVSDFVNQLNHYGDWLFNRIAEISFGTLGGIGMAVFIWMAISMLTQVEHSFNRVWNAPPRSLWRKFSDYLTLIIIVPFLALVASTIPIVEKITPLLGGWSVVFLKSLNSYVAAGKGITLLFTTLLFVVVFLFIPNTKVRFKPALIGGFATALLFLIWMRLCSALQLGVIKYSKLYGGFAILPILLAWVYASWQIMLFGAELCFALQNAQTYGRELSARHAGVRAQWHLALGMVTEIALAMRNLRPAFNAGNFAKDHQLPSRLVHDVIQELQQAGVIDESASLPNTYFLKQDPGMLTVATVVSSVLDRGASPTALGLDNLNTVIRQYLEKAERSWTSFLETPIQQLVSQIAADSTPNTQ